MRHRATHLLHILLRAPVAALTAAVTLALPVHAQGTAAPSPPATRPAPFVVALDPGHGGSPDNTRPDQLFDPGVIGPNGVQEKDVTLDVAKRLATLLRSDAVKVVLTRTDDSYVDIGPRMQTAIDAGAQLFVSVHFNSFTDPTTGGTLILYPSDDALAFAQTMSDALAGALLQRFSLANDGVQSKPDLWVHATMPAITVEAAYLTNPREADLVKSNAFLDALAGAIRDGVEKQAPQIATLKAQILAWNAAHHSVTSTQPGTVPAVAPQADGGTTAGALLRWVIVLALIAAAVRWRRRLVPVLRWTWAAGWSAASAASGHKQPQHRRSRRGGRAVGTHTLTLATSWKSDSAISRSAPAHRRRRNARRRAVLQRAAPQAPTRRSVYDELWF
ncbi:MAG TPA: N-acetylmuramoyl-L-alanine amidase [Candidatus Dormibacteraeota bacterium]|jgi:N-acetylmuramoyl-L-alanine amidase|nr:N-acetylmuramoyl-L-alanine amidase [Candidatus Dormibacteraeota bacterium]